ncbi:helix-turn-helix domain-containing protein, partial [Crenothrix polyspora]|uniref:helix-turn-helix domain-containing protein n=1 Tax=Crenothrix polyspora TaxID=360316 RepID=UPI00111D30E7
MKWYEKAKNIMKDTGITQTELIPVFNVKTRGAVGHYLTGRREPTGAQLKALSSKLNCSLDLLLTDKAETLHVDSTYPIEAMEFFRIWESLTPENRATLRALGHALMGVTNPTQPNPTQPNP